MNEPAVRSDTRFAKIPEGLLCDTSLPHVAVRVFGALHRFGTTPETCFPTVRLIAERAGTNERSVARALDALEDAGWVDRVPRTAHGMRTSSGYRLYEIPRSHALPLSAERSATSGRAALPLSAEPALPLSAEEREPPNESHLTRPPHGPPAASAEVVPISSAIADVTFDDFWEAYPRQEGRGAAAQAWRRAAARAPAGDILAGARRLAADPNLVPRYVPAPKRWLDEDRWADGPLPERNERPTSPTDDLLRRIAETPEDPWTVTTPPSASAFSAPPTRELSSPTRRSLSG